MSGGPVIKEVWSAEGVGGRLAGIDFEEAGPWSQLLLTPVEARRLGYSLLLVAEGAPGLHVQVETPLVAPAGGVVAR